MSVSSSSNTGEISINSHWILIPSLGEEIHPLTPFLDQAYHYRTQTRVISSQSSPSSSCETLNALGTSQEPSLALSHTHASISIYAPPICQGNLIKKGKG